MVACNELHARKNPFGTHSPHASDKSATQQLKAQLASACPFDPSMDSPHLSCSTAGSGISTRCATSRIFGRLCIRRSSRSLWNRRILAEDHGSAVDFQRPRRRHRPHWQPSRGPNRDPCMCDHDRSVRFALVSRVSVVSGVGGLYREGGAGVVRLDGV